MAERAALVVCAWAVHGALHEPGAAVTRALRPLHPLPCLGTTREGFPRHPLYVLGITTPVPYDD
jgi:hypothetical protein